jgi:hypothetical protein
MDVKFLSLDPSDIPERVLLSELLPDVNKFMVEFYNIRTDVVFPSKRSSVIEKFKLLVDIIEIYKRPELLKVLRDNVAKNSKEELDKENERKRQEFMKQQIDSQFNQNNMFRNMFGNNQNNIRPESDNESDNESDISDDELDQDRFVEMLNSSYDNIKKNSALKKIGKLTRKYDYYLEGDTDRQISTETTDKKTSNSDPDQSDDPTNQNGSTDQPTDQNQSTSNTSVRFIDGQDNIVTM